MSINCSVLPPLQRDSSCMSELKSTSRCLRMHLNSLWSIWYGIGVAILNGYIAFECSKRFLDYVDRLPTADTTTYQYELFVCIGLTGFAVLLIPFFFASALFKIGNLANDGFKLGRNLSTCSANSQSSVVFSDQSGCQRMWQHCGPTASLFHLVIAFCFLIPKLMIEARCVQKKMLPLYTIWKTDLDFLIPHQEETVSLNFTSGISMDASTVFSNQPKSLPLSVTPGLEIQIRNDTNFGSVSIEFLNYALALFIYSVRYPSVFWNTNKYFGVLFSMQLIINGVQCLLIHTGVCILYKIHVVGPQEVLPATARLTKWTSRFGTPFILNREVTLALYVMSVVLVLVSSLVLYLYGYGRLNSFLNRERARHIILVKGTQSGRTWMYFTHCAALCILVAIGVCEAPLLYDFTLIYRKNLDLLVLAVILSSILHLFVWVLLWLILTLKQHWEFKLQVTVGRSTVRSARSIRMITDVQLAFANQDYTNVPLLVVGHGRTFTVSEPNSKKAIMTVIQKATMEKKLKFGQAGSSSSNRTVSEDGEEQIYWLRPKSRTPRHSPDSSSSETRFGWFSKKKSTKLSVEEMAILPKRNKSNGMVGEEDSGDYVRLREIPGADSTSVALPKGDHGDDTTSEDNKLMESVRNDRITYASVNKDLLNPILREYEDPSPLLTPEPQDHDDLPPPPPELSVEFNHCIRNNMRKDVADGLQRADSGMPQEEIPSHSDSEVSGGSPPDRTGSNSETSSGVHSNSSRESENVGGRLMDQKAGYCGGPPMTSLFSETRKIHPQQWIQRNVIHSPPPYNSARVYKPQQHYANTNKTPVINEVAEEQSTVVIRRKNSTNAKPPPLSPEAVTDRFSRSTNMRLTSFTDHQHLHHHLAQAEQQQQQHGKLSATLPHYPTSQPVGVPYQHCSTMPLPVSGINCNPLNNGASCGSFPRPHTTIPTHHNGVRLGGMPAAAAVVANNALPYTEFPLPAVPHGYHTNSTMVVDPSSVYSAVKTSHHTFPQLPVHPAKLYLRRNAERDSANFSIGSSGGESDVCNGNLISS